MSNKQELKNEIEGLIRAKKTAQSYVELYSESWHNIKGQISAFERVIQSIDNGKPINKYATLTPASVEQPKQDDWVYVNPDNRKALPDGEHCECCKKPTNGKDSVVSVELSNDGLYARLKKFGGKVIGKNCWNKNIKEFGFQSIEQDNMPVKEPEQPSEAGPSVDGELLEALKDSLLEENHRKFSASQIQELIARAENKLI